jgi:beta-lactamase class A
LGIQKLDIEEMDGDYKQWLETYPASTNADTRTVTITDNKNLAKEKLTQTLRKIFKDIPESLLTVQDRNTLNLVEKSTGTPTPVPVTRPVGNVDTSMRLQHTIHFKDEATPQSKARPARVRGCQIWHKVGGDAPKDPKELQYLATDTASPYVAHFDGADAGKPVYYWLRWENTIAETGPWSETIMATITA